MCRDALSRELSSPSSEQTDVAGRLSFVGNTRHTRVNEHIRVKEVFASFKCPSEARRHSYRSPVGEEMATDRRAEERSGEPVMSHSVRRKQFAHCVPSLATSRVLIHLAGITASGTRPKVFFWLMAVAPPCLPLSSTALSLAAPR